MKIEDQIISESYHHWSQSYKLLKEGSRDLDKDQPYYNSDF
jgi:hypothetical protein